MKKIKALRDNQKGFTLVELIIVLAIIGLLIAVAIPIYNNVLDTAAKRTDESNVKMINNTIMVYYSENDKYPEAEDFEGLISELSEYLQQNKIEVNREGYQFVYDKSNHQVTCEKKSE